MKRNQIMMIHGTNYEEMTVSLLERAGLADEIGDRGARIALKPNLVVAATAEEGAVTHPEIVAGVLKYLQQNGFRRISVMEGSWVGARTAEAVRASGIEAVCRQYGVPFVDLQRDGSHAVDAEGMKLQVCDQVDQVDFLINLPVLKGHCQTMLTCAMKNLKGLLPDSEKRRFHTLGLQKPIAHLSAAIRQDFIVVDNICGDLDFEEGGNPVVMNRVFCCKDPVLCDAFGCQTLGLGLEDVPYIKMGERLGVGCADVKQAEVIAVNACTAAVPQKASRRVRKLEKYMDAKDACSACYGMLIHALDKMDRVDELWGHQQKICIGQGYRGKQGEIGVGTCTKDCAKSLRGCPPVAEDILAFLNENWI